MEDEADYALPIFAARIPVAQHVGAIEPSLCLPPGVAVPEGLAGFTPGRRLDETLAENSRKG